MTPEPHTDLFPNVEYLDLGLEDMRSADISVFFDEGHQFLTRAREDGAVALVHCHMGKWSDHFACNVLFANFDD